KNGAVAYTGATQVTVAHPHLHSGEACPGCTSGKLYPQSEPAKLVRITGVAPLSATVYERERLRCNLCGEVYTAPSPAGGGENARPRARGAAESGSSVPRTLQRRYHHEGVAVDQGAARCGPRRRCEGGAHRHLHLRHRRDRCQAEDRPVLYRRAARRGELKRGTRAPFARFARPDPHVRWTLTQRPQRLRHAARFLFGAREEKERGVGR